MKTTCASAVTDAERTDGYPELERLIAERVAGAKGPLFTTAAENLFQVYLDNIPADRRQHYNCNCCRRFFERYGGLVTIDDTEAAHIRSLLWECTLDVPDFFRPAFSALFDAVYGSRLTGVFLSSESTWGTPFNVPGPPSKHQGERWTHLSGTNPNVFRHPLKTAGQMMAERHEDYGTLQRGLAEYPVAAVEQAVTILRADALTRSEKTLGVAEWLLSLHQQLAGTKGRQRENIVWRAVATAPPGFAHVKSTMIGTLLDDLAGGMAFDAVKRRWADKMHPLQYQRPTAPPSTGAIARAEKIVAELQSAGALDRRFARLSDIVPLWVPRPIEQMKPAGGIFGHLLRQDTPRPLELPAQTMTWEKFSRTVLPDALEIECQVPARDNFCALVTAANPEASPLLQWDGLEGLPRNSVSWYVYHGGSPAHAWNLSAGSWVKVPAICLSPPHWQKPEQFQHQNQAVLLVLAGAKDTRHQRSGGFFPECLRAEYHEIRSVMEAYANRAAIAGKDEGDANGLVLQRGATWGATVRVRSAGGLATYRLDRWD